MAHDCIKRKVHSVIDQITIPEFLEQILLYGNFEIIVEDSFGWKQVIIGKVYE